MDKKQLIAFLGSILLFIGVFTPIISVPFLGSLNYFRNGEGDGVIVLALAVVSALLAFAKLYKGLWLTGGGSLAVLGYTFFDFESRMDKIRSAMNQELAGNPFAGLGKAALNSVQLQWGWALLVVGACLVLVAAVMPEDNNFEDTDYDPNNHSVEIGWGDRRCPFCAEMIRAEAIICRFCKSDLKQMETIGVVDGSTDRMPDIVIQPPPSRGPAFD